MKLFTASWCKPCGVVKQELDKFQHSVDIIDIEENTVATRAAGVRSVPSLLLGDGNVVTGVDNILQAIREAYDKA